MAQTYKDPHSYLNESLVKRGKSGHQEVYLTHVTVVAEAEADYGYRVLPASFDLFSPLGNHYNNLEWLILLVSLRSQTTDTQRSIVLNQATLQFIPEGSDLSLNIFFPERNVETFDYDVLAAQDMLRGVSKFAGKIPTTIRFNLGLVKKSYEAMVEEGEVEEVEFSY
jgi:hypothetical protein